MSQRKEIEARLALFEELSGIMSAMRSFALAELRRVSKREAAQQRVVESLQTALNDVSNGLPTAIVKPTSRTDIWLIFGSVRGFCGSFNEDLVRYWKSKIDPQSELIVVGERLHDMIESSAPIQCVNGADGSLDAPAVIDRILNAISALGTECNGTFSLKACLRDEQGVRDQHLWPLPQASASSYSFPPVTYASASDVATGVAEHYLFHSLLALLLSAIRVENHMRLMQMESALRHLERGGEELQRRRNRLRQEEIVEEIELMVGSRHGSVI